MRNHQERHPFDRILDAIAQESDNFGLDVVQTIHEDISVPVEYVTGPKGGQGVIRSSPGEHPRYEFGHLWASIFSEVERGTAHCSLVIASDSPYARALDQRMNRPILTGVVDRFEDEFIDRLASAIDREFQQ